MTESDDKLVDPLIDEVRTRRQRLVEEHGGLKGWGRYLQEFQRRNPPKLVFPKPPVAPTDAGKESRPEPER